jgi:hypothetical protein
MLPALLLRLRRQISNKPFQRRRRPPQPIIRTRHPSSAGRTLPLPPLVAAELMLTSLYSDAAHLPMPSSP